MKDNEKDISKDPEGFIKENFGENAQAMIDGVDA